MSSYYEKILATGEVKCIDAEIPFEVPKGWQWCRVSSVFLINPKVSADDDDIAAFVPMEAISAGYGSEFRFYEKPWKEIKSGYTAFEDNDIAFAKITPCFQNRKSVILNGLPNGIGAGTTELKILRTYGETINRYYVLYFLETPYFIDEATFKGTANQQRIIVGYLENKLFPLAPLAEQNRIVDKIGILMPIIDKYSKSQDKLDKINVELNIALKKSILQEAIQGKLVPQIGEEDTAKELLDQIKEEKEKRVKEGKLKESALSDSVIYKGDDNKYFEKKGVETICIDDEIPFEIPESWEWCRISSICNITNGFTPLRTEDKFWRNGNINWFTIEDIRTQGEYINYTTQKITKEATAPERIVRPGSVLLCCTASVGQCAFTNIPTTTNQQFNALTIKDYYRHLMIDEYLFLFAKTLKDELHRLSGKTTFEFISVKKVGNILVPIPPLNEQKRIVAIVNKSLTSIMRG